MQTGALSSGAKYTNSSFYELLNLLGNCGPAIYCHSLSLQKGQRVRGGRGCCDELRSPSLIDHHRSECDCASSQSPAMLGWFGEGDGCNMRAGEGSGQWRKKRTNPKVKLKQRWMKTRRENTLLGSDKGSGSPAGLDSETLRLRL